MWSKAKKVVSLIFFIFGACSSPHEPPSEPPAAARAPLGRSGAPQSDLERDTEVKPTPPKLEKPEDPSEACAQIIVVAWKGAAHAGPQIIGDKQQARERATQLLARAKKGADFASLARQSSDGSASGPRGGHIGTYKLDQWPEVHKPIRETVFSLMVNQIADDLVQAPYGYAIVRRCPVERVHTRHILVRYQGAKRSESSVTRTREQAKALAEQIRVDAIKPEADFAKLATERSEDSSAAKGGDIGSPARAMLAPPFEDALFALKPGEISGVVETEFGFHVIQRLAN
jgi:parvulin-like peptidyl-prolyl isomerase